MFIKWLQQLNESNIKHPHAHMAWINIQSKFLEAKTRIRDRQQDPEYVLGKLEKEVFQEFEELDFYLKGGGR